LDNTPDKREGQFIGYFGSYSIILSFLLGKAPLKFILLMCAIILGSALEVVNGLALRGHQVTILSFDNEYEDSFYRFSTSITHLRLGSLGSWSHERMMGYIRMRKVAKSQQATLIDAFAKVQREFPNWTLRIIGQGELRQNIDKQIAALGISERVSIQDASSQIEEEYAAADLFVIPSLYERFGLVTAEASAAGLPCVGFSDCEGTNQIIKDGVSGVLVDPGSDRAASLAAALRRLMQDKQTMRAYGKNGIDLSVRYNLESVLDDWEAVMLDVNAEY